MAFSFVHTADLHLDSPFVGLSRDAAATPGVARLARTATFGALDAVVRACIDRDAEFLLVAGDVFDQTVPSLRGRLAFARALQQLADHGIPSFVVHGNHDPLADAGATALRVPRAATVFDSETAGTGRLTTRDGRTVAVSGISYRTAHESRRLHRHYQRDPAADFHVGLLHCSMTCHRGDRTYCEVDLDELAARDLDYWALGHVHERRIVARDPWVVYPGNTQGRHVGESGPRGCYYVTVTDDGEVRPEFVPTAPVAWAREEIDVSGLDDLLAVSEALHEAVARLPEAHDGRSVFARLYLVGRTRLHHDLRSPRDRADLLAELREACPPRPPLVWVEQLDDHTASPLDRERRAQAEDLLGAVLRQIDEVRASPALADILGPAAAELLQDRRARRELTAPDADEWQQILARAEAACVELLEDTAAP